MMRIHGYTKPIKLFQVRYTRTLNGSPKYTYQELSSDTTIGACTPNDVIELSGTKRTFNQNNFGKLTEGATLYFDKSATFPRYKLEGSGFKRCIKKEKADFIIVGKTDVKGYYRSWFYVYEDPNYMYVAYYATDDATNQKAFREAGLTNMKLVWNGRCNIYGPDSQILLETNPTKPLIYDTDLDAYINKTLPTITESDVKQILTMLASNDNSIVDLGLKTLASYDTTSRPMTTKAILLVNNGWTKTNGSTSVAVETMLTSLELTRSQCAYYNLKTRLGYINQTSIPYADEDKTLARSIMRDCIAELLEKELYPFRRIFESENMNFKITLNVEG